ncbi:hypothetical protein [Mycobacterium sp.]|uniref:hypothetical protein n=1 Tax=Mycobacterium sp. TaxID=1785 RepID=UPI0031D25876
MKSYVIAAGAAAAAAGVLSLAIPAAHHTHHDAVGLVTTENDMLLSLEGVSMYPTDGVTGGPLGDVATASGSDFYNVYTGGSTASGAFEATDPTKFGATDLLNSSLIIDANQALGLGDTDGYVGLSPTSTPDVFTFGDQEAVSYDYGLQALLTAFNQSVDPTAANLDPAQLGTATEPLSLTNDLTVAYQDFVSFFDLAAGITP